MKMHLTSAGVKNVLRELKNECLHAIGKGDINWRINRQTKLRAQFDRKGNLTAVQRQSKTGTWRKFLAADEISAILCSPVTFVLKPS